MSLRRLPSLGQRVGDGVAVQRLHQADVLAEADPHAEDHRDERRDGEPDRDLVQAAEVIPGQDADRDGGEDRGEDDRRAVDAPQLGLVGEGEGGAARDQQAADQPYLVEPASVVAGRGLLVQVDPVADGPGDQPGGDRQELAGAPDPADDQRADDEADRRMSTSG